MRLSILDQSPIATGSNARTALQQTCEIAQLAERLGYSRFWVSEHHDAVNLAGSTPEVLISHLAARTNSIRVGSGGVMLPHYSAYKVAENFRMLEALYPNRIDLGVGRAPGGMPRSTMALQEGRAHRADYRQQVQDLQDYLTDSIKAEHRFQGLTARPVIDTAPELWLLGSSTGSARIAAERGAPFMFAQFINGEGGPQTVRQYTELFQPSVTSSKPQAAVAIFCICAPTDEEANYVASSLDLALVMLANGQRSAGTPSLEVAANYAYNQYELAVVRENRKRMVIGSPQTVRQQILQLIDDYGVDEVMIATTTAEFEHRRRSVELVHNALQSDLEVHRQDKE